jgi:hypothetical protein
MMLDNDPSTEAMPMAGNTTPTSNASDRGPSKPRRSGQKSELASKQTTGGRSQRGSAAKPIVRAPSKQDRVVAMLRRKEGASIAAIVKATGWQKHSVRGFFAGVVRKKLRLNLTSEETGGKRIYRIAPGKASARKRSR